VRMSRRAAIALAAVFLGLTAAGTAAAKTKKEHHHHHRHHHREKPGAEGKDHLKRANALAGEGDCAAAIEEYTKAYELLSDPVVLFNRAECYRRTGNGENAVDDYRGFLDKVPNAPNRAAIEAKIVALEAPEPAAREGSKPPARETTKPPGETSKPVARETSKPPPAESPKVAPPPQKVAEETPPPVPPLAPKPEDKAEPEVVVGATRGVDSAPTVRSDDSAPTGGSRPWVWIALSVLAAGAAVGGYFLLRPKEEPPPASTLGNYPF
jgi:tetratricopeptide (TPR) repeat protein